MTRHGPVQCRDCGGEARISRSLVDKMVAGHWWNNIALQRCDQCRAVFDVRYTVTFQWSSRELEAVADVAHQRIAEAARMGLLSDRSTDVERGWRERYLREFQGAFAEAAFCHLIDVPWSRSVNTFHNVPDVEPDWEIRSTHEDGHCLLLRDNDPPERRYVLAVVNRLADHPTVKFVGAITGTEGRKRGIERDPGGKRPAWFVDPWRLIPVEDWFEQDEEAAL